MEYLLQIALGPVQDFIASARRSRDLFFGSFLLSELAKACADSLSQNGATLIFPSVGSDLTPNGALNVSNVLLVRCSDPARLAELARDAAIKRLSDLAMTTFANLAIIPNVPMAQIKDLLEFYWAAAPIDTNYAAARQLVGAALAARKNTRHFAPPTWSSTAVKSSLDGARESVIAESNYPPRNATPVERTMFSRSLYDHFGVRIGERLCAVGLLKRRGEIPDLDGQTRAFVSSSHMAAMPLLERMNNLPDKKRLEAALTRFFSLGNAMGRHVLGRTAQHHSLLRHYDARVLYRDRLAEYLHGSQLEELQSSLGQVLAAAGVSQPLPYYAILHADGDKIGKALDGCQTAETHQDFSAVLSSFAGQVYSVVAAHGGSTVYAGGDDVLAMLPLHTAIACTAKLAQIFADLLKNYGSVGEQPTLSAGLVVVHHLEPLEDALNWAREAEKAAKNTYGRNALAITIAKRGGVNFTIGGHWDELDTMLEKFITMHLNDQIPDGAAYELRHVSQRLTGLPVLQRAEAVRILTRKRSQRGTTALDPNLIADLHTAINQTSLEEISNRLIAARLFAEAYRMVNP